MASRFREILKDHPKLKGKEIFLVEEHKKEIGTYVVVFIQPFKVNDCKSKKPNHAFLPGGNVYHFGYAFEISDKIKYVGLGCYHFNYEPTPEELNFKLHSFLRCRNDRFFDECESALEKQFEAAFGAA